MDGNGLTWPIQRIVSGGQTGVDRAALDFALQHHVPCGGWCPRGRLAEDGIIPACYPLQEARSRRYAERTRLNVIDSDGTLILHRGTLKGGTALTWQFAKQYHKPCLVINLSRHTDATTEQQQQEVQQWLTHEAMTVLNVAGPRESENSGIYQQAFSFIKSISMCYSSIRSW
ncbi:MAG: putative molybdenum carrier protein [Magnetococcales bacterium]|nr:putative molybdenum carrier protein [Magnetococcales bacterium]